MFDTKNAANNELGHLVHGVIKTTETYGCFAQWA